MTRVLVVDDEQSIAYVARAVLEDEGYEVAIARDGREALDLLEHELVDVIVTDLMMPRLDGWALCRQVQSDPRLQAIPIIVMSAVTDVHMRDGCTFASVLGKPFDIDRLVELVGDVLVR